MLNVEAISPKVNYALDEVLLLNERRDLVNSIIIGQADGSLSTVNR